MVENKMIERIELNTETGKYIKCNHCSRLSPAQKYCKYCFSRLDGGQSEQEVRQIFITRPKSLPPAVADYSRVRERIDADFTTGKVDYAALGLTEEEYNLKFSPPPRPTADEHPRPMTTQKFDEVYKRFERQPIAHTHAPTHTHSETEQERAAKPPPPIDKPAAPAAPPAPAKKKAVKPPSENEQKK